jgi:hypothetical protein
VIVRIKIAGPCASGKSTLAARLRALGYDAGSTAQDHSYVPDMWQRINPPDLLIYLDLSLATAWQRGRIDWTPAILDEQNHRLRHARAHCDLYLCTDGLIEAEVVARVLDFLDAVGVTPSPLLGVIREDG